MRLNVICVTKPYQNKWMWFLLGGKYNDLAILDGTGYITELTANGIYSYQEEKYPYKWALCSTNWDMSKADYYMHLANAEYGESDNVTLFLNRFLFGIFKPLKRFVPKNNSMSSISFILRAMGYSKDVSSSKMPKDFIYENI